MASDRTALVLYGSETGNAQDMAEQLGETFERLHFQATVEEMDAVDLNALLRNQLVVFVVSTTGQGDMPHNSLLFWKRLLRRKLPPGCLSQLKYTCFGLGDSTYLKFNWAARKLVRRLDQLGASTFIEGFEADEQFPDGVDGSFVRWADGLYKHIVENYPHPDQLEPIPDDTMLPPRWSMEPALKDLDPNAKSATSPTVSGPPPTNLLPIPNGWLATLSENKRMTPDSHWQDVRLISFDVASTSQPLQVNPGDCLTVFPKNFPADAEKLISLMEWNAIADQPLTLSSCASLPRSLHANPTCTLRELLLNHIDINSIPRRSFLKNMSYFCTDPDHKERLLEFTMTEYLDEYFDYATRSRRTIIEVLEEFTSVKIPAARILDVFPLIRGRDFSIANGGNHLRHPSEPSVTRVQLLVALVKYRTILRKPREGLCSRYLAELPLGTQLCVSHKPVLSPIHGEANSKRPLIAMATGTGVAPVRCLIQERLTHPSPAPVFLFFGNRNRAADYFFGDEWEAAQMKDQLTSYPAFSRDQREKIYVQDLIRKESSRISSLIPDNPIFAVCGGSSKMADACKAAVFDPFLANKEGDEKDAAQKILDNVTWWQEIW